MKQLLYNNMKMWLMNFYKQFMEVFSMLLSAGSYLEAIALSQICFLSLFLKA